MSHTHFLNLLAKKMNGEASPGELHELENLMKLNPDWAYQAEHLEHFWQYNSETDKHGSGTAFEQHLLRMQEAGIDFPQQKTPQTNFVTNYSTKKKKIFAFSVAAIIVFVSTAFVWITLTKKDSSFVAEKNYSEVSSPLGSKTKLVLPDSTVVWLNAGSKLTYNEHFGTTNRNTTLVGEAFFDVKKSAMPFVIRANTIQIKVLGTAFNVKAYPDEKTTETSLIRGRVEVTLDKRPGQSPFILHPNEKLVVSNDQEEIKPNIQQKEPIVVWKGLTRTTDSIIVETSWINNKLIFQNDSFEDVAHKMERWYGVTIEFKDVKLMDERLSGTFTKETIREALTALQLSTKFHFSIRGNLITITNK
jgi:transmembrane sensor